MSVTISRATLTRTRRSTHLDPVGSDVLLGEIEVIPASHSTCRIDATSESGISLYALHGELDAATAGEVRSLLSSARNDSSVVLDLVGLTALDAEGVEVLREKICNVHLHGGRVAISRSWRLALQMTGLAGTKGLVFLSFSAAGSIAWMERLPPGFYLSSSVETDRLFSGDQLSVGS